MHILNAMVPEAQRLHSTLVSAFPAYVTGVFAERGYPLNRTTALAIEEATAFLDVELAVVLDQEYREQRRSPLELFRAALEMLAATLTDAAVSPAATEPSTAEIDTYRLAPGSSSALGPEAHEAHLAWGAAKASAFLAERSDTPSEPAILLMAADRGEQDALVPLLKSPGMRCMAARNPAAVARAIEQWAVVSAFVDFSHRSVGDAITRLVEANVPTVVYGDDVDDLVETGLRAQGVRAVIARDDFVADPTRFLPRLA
ncbi:MAG: hypothetical protein U9R51_02635 [Actinomycetota bacterium]|nr:hypothetical protein [Actinomycetota bacterium]